MHKVGESEMSWGEEGLLSLPKNKGVQWWGLGVVLFLLLVGVILLVNLRKPQDLLKQAVGPTPDATISMASTPTTLSNLQVGNTFTVNLGVTTTTNSFYGADFVMEFNKNVVEVTDIALLNPNTTNGCTISSGGLVLAPITSETDCAFKKTAVMSSANGSGILDFGAVSFNWTQSSNSGYTPISFPANAPKTLAIVTFRAKSTGTSTIKFTRNTNCGTGTQNCTTDTNVAAVSNTNEVGDIIASVVPANGLTATVSETTCTKFAQGDTDCNGTIDIFDINEGVKVIKGQTSQFNTDINGDGVTDIFDLNIIVQSIKNGV